MVTHRPPRTSEEWGIVLVGLIVAYVLIFLAQGWSLSDAVVNGILGGGVMTAILAVFILLVRGIRTS